MIEEKIAALNDGKLPFGVFLVPTQRRAGFLGLAGKYHLVFTAEALHWVVLKGSLLRNDLRFVKESAAIAWDKFVRFRYEHVHVREMHFWQLIVDAEGTRLSWREDSHQQDLTTEAQQYAELGKAFFFYKHASPDGMMAWWDDAMKDATGDRDARDYLYLMERHFQPDRSAGSGNT